MIPQLLNDREAARMLRVQPCTVRNERIRGNLGFTQIGARIFYALDQINEYVERQRVNACASNNSKMDKLEAIGPAKSERPIDAWCLTWYDNKARQTRRESLGTTDFREACLKVAEHALLKEKPQDAKQEEILISTCLLIYWEEHGKFSSAIEL